MSLYLEHFGLREPPFRITPHTDFFFTGANRGPTLDALIYAITQDEGIVKVTGEVGSGKTMLCRMLLERLPADVESLYLANPSLSRSEILGAIADELGIPADGKTTHSMIRTLQDALVERYAAGKRVVIMIDEAHAMPAESLEEIRLLSNLESKATKLLQIALFAQPELDERLAANDMRQLRERITQHFNLAPLKAGEVGNYIEFRLRAAGYHGPNPFTPRAVELIARLSEGLSRRINILADKALLAAYSGGGHQVDAAEVKIAAQDARFAASCKSAITYIDGDAGVLLYRGYPIEQLAEKSNFLEVAYLLMNGELPNKQEFDAFEHEVTHHTMMHEAFRTFLYGFRHDAHPMAMLVGMLGSMASFYHNELDLEDPAQRRLAAIRLIAKVPTIAAACHRYSIGWPMRYPKNSLDYTTRFLHMMKEVPAEPLELDPVAAKALDLLFILHADHEQNASTSTVRLIGSTGANPYACIAGGVAALWGPAHGGANEAVLKMLAEIGRPENVGSAVDKAKDKNSGFRLMGFGHRVYKNYDPRAALVRKMTHDVLGALNVNDPLLEVALKLEEAALKDDYFVARKLYPNVDFYSGLIYKALGIPVEMFTVMFAIARTAGWVSHWLEQQEDPENKIGRPRQIYTGAAKRDYVDASRR